MAQPVPPISLLVKEGGRYISGGATGAISPRDYVAKTNFRRLDDAEMRREGTLKFRPNLGLPQGSQAFEVGPEVVGVWEAIRPNGDRAVVLLTPTTVYKFTNSTGLWTTVGGPFTSCNEWQVESLDGYLIFNNKVDLMFTYRVEDSTVTPIYEMRDIGIASVNTFTVYNGFLLVADITEIASTELTAWLNGLTPYGVPPSNICNRIRYKIAWSDYGQPRNWAPLIVGATINSSDRAKVILPHPMPYAFPVGAKLAVIGAGPSGGTLGGQIGIDDGVVVTAVAGAELTLSVAADVSLTYPLTVQVVRFADVSTFVGSSSIQDDSSAVLLLKPLKRGLVVYRDTGIWVGRYTAIVETPFVFTPEWSGRIVPSHPRAVADVNGDYHVYPSRNRFYKFDGAGEPRLHEPLDDARTMFFDGLTAENSGSAWAIHNPITKEIWFFCPNGVLAFDYVGGTTSWIDETYTAAAFIHRPGTDERWFILARAGMVLQYGATEEVPITYLRLGEPVTCRIKFGVTSLGDDLNEKVLLGHNLLIGTDAEDIEVTVKLSGGDNLAKPFEELLEQTISPAELSLIETFYQNIYFQDEIVITDTDDVGLSIVGRDFLLQRVRSRGVTRNANGHL